MVVDAHGLKGQTFDAPLSRKFWWENHHVWSFGVWLVTISKLLIYLHAYSFVITYSMFIFFMSFVLHVVNTSLNVVFIKTCIYTYTNSEQHLFHICLHFMLICTHYMHMYKLVLMILSFIHALPNFMILLHVYVFLIQI